MKYLIGIDVGTSGTKSKLWRKMLADIYAVPVKTLESSEGAALGAAILGGCAAGVYASVEEGCDRTVKVKDTTAPDMENHKKYMKVYEIYNGLYSRLKESFHKLKNL